MRYFWLSFEENRNYRHIATPTLSMSQRPCLMQLKSRVCWKCSKNESTNRWLVLQLWILDFHVFWHLLPTVHIPHVKCTLFIIDILLAGLNRTRLSPFLERIPMEHIHSNCSFESPLHFEPTIITLTYLNVLSFRNPNLFLFVKSPVSIVEFISCC